MLNAKFFTILNENALEPEKQPSFILRTWWGTFDVNFVTFCDSIHKNDCMKPTLLLGI